MKREKSILGKRKRYMSKRFKGKLIGKMSEISSVGFGSALYLRPYLDDERFIEELAAATGEKKSAVAQKLLHLALHTPVNERVRESRQLELLDWLIMNEKHKAEKNVVAEARLERLEEHSRELEKRLQAVEENSNFNKIIVSEIYCMSIICMSISNQIFTKIIEYLSPVEIERKNSTEFANLNVLGLLEHSFSEFENLSDHHQPELDSVETEMLYLFTKIEKIKERVLPFINKREVEK